jgi:hypothetical protein
MRIHICRDNSVCVCVCVRGGGGGGLEAQQLVMSSTYTNVATAGPTMFTILFMAIANRVKLRTDPCGTPFS